MPKSFQFTVNITMDETTFAHVRELLRESPGVVPMSAAIRPSQPPIQSRTSVGEQPLILTTKEAAKLLGVCERTLGSLSKARKMPQPVKIGAAVRWNHEELRAWIAAGGPSGDEWEKQWRKK